MRPEVRAVALGYVPGDGPVTLTAIATGGVNETWRVERAGRSYALRLAMPGAADPGLDRAWECRVLAAAAAAGITPALERCLPEQGVLVLHWADGRRWTEAEACAPASLAALAHLVRRIQALPVPAQPRVMSIEAWIAHYASRSDASGIEIRVHPAVRAHDPTLSRRLAALAELPPVAPVLCHGDLHRDNLIVNEAELTLIDWEYSHLADPLWDLAGWCSSNDLGDSARRQLLEAYRGQAPKRVDLARLELLCWLYDYLCLLWSVLTTQAAASAPIAPSGPSAPDAIAVFAERLSRSRVP